MTLDPDSVGSSAEPYRATWTSRDAVTYALAIGAGVNELDYTTENTLGVDQQVYPTFAAVVGHGQRAKRPSYGTFQLAKGLHGEQALTLYKPLPVKGDVTIQNTVAAMYDKGNDAVVVLEGNATDNTDGTVLFTRRTVIFIRGGGGWGGVRGPTGPRNTPPDRRPDHEVAYTTSPDQALLYRLTGDGSRIHSDPAFAAEAGFDRPTLAGLCTYGFSGRALLHTLCDGTSARFEHIEGRFSSPVFPGETLTVRMWATEHGQAEFTTSVDDRAVITHGLFRYRS